MQVASLDADPWIPRPTREYHSIVQSQAAFSARSGSLRSTVKELPVLQSNSVSRLVYPVEKSIGNSSNGLASPRYQRNIQMKQLRGDLSLRHQTEKTEEDENLEAARSLSRGLNNNIRALKASMFKASMLNLKQSIQQSSASKDTHTN